MRSKKFFYLIPTALLIWFIYSDIKYRFIGHFANSIAEYYVIQCRNNLPKMDTRSLKGKCELGNNISTLIAGKFVKMYYSDKDTYIVGDSFGGVSYIFSVNLNNIMKLGHE